MNKQEIDRYLEDAKKIGLDVREKDILFLVSLMKSIIDESISNYKKQ